MEQKYSIVFYASPLYFPANRRKRAVRTAFRRGEGLPVPFRFRTELVSGNYEQALANATPRQGEFVISALPAEAFVSLHGTL